MGTLSLTTLVIGLIICVLVYLALREVNCWYWKINRRIELQEETNELLKKLIEKNEIKKGKIVEADIEQTSLNDPNVMAEMLKKLGKKE